MAAASAGKDWRIDVRAAAQRHLNSGCTSLLKNAIFLCERLTEGVVIPELSDLLLHAHCLEKNQEYRAALGVLEKAGKPLIVESEEARFIKATCLFKLNAYVDAKACLLYDPAQDRLKTPEELRVEVEHTGRVTSVPKGAFGLHLLGLIASQHAELEEESNLYFELAVKLDPYLFQARERLAISQGRRESQDETRVTTTSTSPSSPGDMLKMLEHANYLLASYRCDEALQCLSALPLEQQKTSYALCLMGRAYFEKADYASACSVFERMRTTDPNRTEGLEVYSTALWHLKREVDLAYLARDVSERAPKSPQTWCVVGNCFSLEKEHDLAIRFFKRALQLDENFTYAYTLAGHEYIANEDFEEATACYRHALRTDRSHYNAWWGLGTIYSRQEKHDLAELHFRRAITIHPTSSVLYCYLGTVLAKLGRYEDSLIALDHAKRLQPNNPQARYQRAKVLFHSEQLAEALKELEVVLDVVPKEASVHMFMGQVCARLNERDRAMMHFVEALNLDPKGAPEVRAALNRLSDSEVEAPGQRDFDID